MSYRDPRQSLEDSLHDLLSAIDAFSQVVDRRIDSNEWSQGHILEINSLRIRLLELKPQLTELKERNW